MGAIPEATAAADPPDEPPGVCSGFQGLRVMPRRSDSVKEIEPNSGVVVLPMRTKPASRNRRTTSSSAFRRFVGYADDPCVVVQPSTSLRSLIGIGTPMNGGRSAGRWHDRRGRSAGRRPAPVRRRGGRRRSTIGSSSSTRPRWCSMTSVGLTSSSRDGGGYVDGDRTMRVGPSGGATEPRRSEPRQSVAERPGGWPASTTKSAPEHTIDASDSSHTTISDDVVHVDVAGSASDDERGQARCGVPIEVDLVEERRVHVGIAHRRAHRVDTHAVSSELEGRGSGQAADTELRRRVRHRGVHALEGTDRGDVDDRPRARRRATRA